MSSGFLLRAAVLLSALVLPGSIRGQNRFEYGGSFEQAATLFSGLPNPSDTRSSAGGHFQVWSRSSLSRGISWRGSIDLRLDSHRNVDRGRWTDVAQRGLRQPAGSLGELFLDVKVRQIDLRVGKQEIRWGRADGFNPTDNLIPYDYLDTFSDERIAVPAVKADAYLGRSRFESVWIPFMTPTRLPLLNQRWFPVLPPKTALPLGPSGEPAEVSVAYTDGPATIPSRTFGNGQWGLRWNQILSRAEFSLSYFDGWDDIPRFAAEVSDPVFSRSAEPLLWVALDRRYFRVRVAGADFASALGPVGIRAEAAYFDRRESSAPDHLLFVAGADRSWGDWFVIVQYAGQHVSGGLGSGAVFPDLGLRSTMLFRIERTLGPSRAVEFEGAVRLRDGDFYLRPSYTVTLTNHWRLKVGASVFAGPRSGFLGQYRDSSHLFLQLRWAF